MLSGQKFKAAYHKLLILSRIQRPSFVVKNYKSLMLLS